MKMFRRAFLILLLFLLVAPAKAADCPWYYGFLRAFGWKPPAVTLSTGIRVEPVFGYNGKLDSVKITDELNHEVSYERTDRSLRELQEEGFYPPEFFDKMSLPGKVLDVGTGNGQLVFDLKAKGFDVHGLDVYLTPKQIKSGLFRQADVRDTGYPSGEFKVIFATETILSYPNAVPGVRKDRYTDQVLRELRRLLADNGVLRVSTIPMPSKSENGKLVVDEAALSRQYVGTGMRVKSYSKDLNSDSRGWLELEKIP